jgi:hypothetical protein
MPDDFLLQGWKVQTITKDIQQVVPIFPDAPSRSNCVAGLLTGLRGRVPALDGVRETIAVRSFVISFEPFMLNHVAAWWHGVLLVLRLKPV